MRFEKIKGKIKLNKIAVAFFAILFIFTSIINPVVVVKAQQAEDINSPSFKLMFCDGPAGVRATLDKSSAEYKNFVACDFAGFMGQIKRLINVMITVGVLAAIVGFCYAGFLYIQGVPAKITRAHEIFQKVGVGFVLMLSAWAIVFQILTWLTDNQAVKGLLQ